MKLFKIFIIIMAVLYANSTAFSAFSANKIDLKTKNDIKEIWKIYTSINRKSDVDCGNYYESVKALLAKDDNHKKIILNKKIEKTKLTLIIPQDESLDTPYIKKGLFLTELWFKEMKEYFDRYPCKNLIIYTKGGSAVGGAGMVSIGGEGGFDNFSLIWHELTHSYFGSNKKEALWLTEGVSQAIYAILAEKVAINSLWDNAVGGIPPNLEFDGVEAQFKKFTTPENWEYDYGKIYLEKNACELKEPVIQQDVTENANWGRVFLLDLVIQFGQEPVFKTLNAIYKKNHFTFSKKISNNDFYKAFIYYLNGYPSESVKTKLCL